MRGRDRDRARSHAILIDDPLQSLDVIGLDDRALGQRHVDPPGPRGEEDARRRQRALGQRPADGRREAVVDDGLSAAIDVDAVTLDRVIARQDQDHLQPRERLHHPAVVGPEAGQALGRGERKVHAGFQHEAVRLHELIQIVALRVADEVRDRTRVLRHQDERRVAGEPVTQARQSGRQARAHQQGGRIHRAGADDDDPGVDPVIARLPRRRLALLARRHRVDPGDHRSAVQSQHLTTRRHLHAGALRPRELHPVGPLLGLIGTAEVAEARAAAAFDVHRELLDAVAQPVAPADEELIVLVDQIVGEEVNVVLLHELAGAALDLFEAQARHVPAADDSLGRDDRRPRVDDGRSAVGHAHRQRHRAVGRENGAAAFVKRLRHLQLAARVLVVTEAWPLLEDDDAHVIGAKRRQLLGHGAAAGARPDDDDVESQPLHLRASHPRGSGR